MTSLLYHSNGSDANSSPFDDAVLQVAQGSIIKIVSPYIGLRYLQRIIEASIGWTLVSDIEAWLSFLSSSERARTLPFIHANLEKIHHCSAIHAKTVISPTLAYLGSANLTITGILNRTEMGVLLEDPRLVTELNDWFDGVWTQTEPPDTAEITEFADWLDQQALTAAAGPPKKSLSSAGQRVAARLTNRPNLGVGPVAIITAKPVKQQQKVPAPVATFDIYDPGVVISLVDTLVVKGFGFQAFVQAAHRQSVSVAQRDLYFALLLFCANHPRSIFAADTLNRLLFINGVFVQSTPEQLKLQQKPYDEYLSSLILALAFDEARLLPSSAQLQKATGLREARQRLLISSLVESGLLQPRKDTGNSPVRYALKSDFIWSRRFQLFSKAYKNWTKCLSRSAADNTALRISAAKESDDAPAAVQPIESWPFVINKKIAVKPESPSHAMENDDAPVLAAARSVKPDPANFAPPEPHSESLQSKAIRIIRPSDHTALIWAIEPIFSSEADRIDELYLHLAKILEPSTGFFNFKSIKAFVMYVYAHYREDKEFIEQVLIGNINKTRLFYITIGLEKMNICCKVELNLDADMNEYPKTYKFMKKSAEVLKRNLLNKKNGLILLKYNRGFFARTVGYKALAQCDPQRKSAAIKRENALRRTALAKEDEAKQKTLAERQAYLDDGTVKAIKEAYARLDRADQVFESLLFLVQLYGNQLPLETEIEVFKKISDRTNIRIKEVERIFKNETNPFTLSILKASGDDTETCCLIQLNHSYSGNLEVLPRTKKLLDMASLN
ncbi:phospholipase D-like domain-containing protein [Polaromonas naphthalenivorans]|uniref:Phospholipase D-like domain-containing protein n=1 Tax=Polaromonas naphthalenivorans (strain CJ2) TaxID=365044 RepID=A1VUT8_POLNA|nr:phospholipase D-like domain-containing protein [Polaromonas naphthalenivorans]ABM39416.1 hypothetical protein Pnap_4127 [Polaromonas naphthalenivorans CJ2]